MTKKHSTKRALVASILTLCMCFTMLIGTTFAWFTDSATSSGNVIKTGTLDVEMYWADGKLNPADTATTWTDATQGAIFNNANWEPGYAEVRHIKIANLGTLALKYKVQIVANGEVSDLANVIDVYYVDPATQIADASALTADKKLGTLADALANLGATGTGNLAAGKADTITIAFKMQDTAGNEYQNLAIGTDFSVQILATQTTAETDSFGDQYDKDATYPNLPISVSSAESFVSLCQSDMSGKTIVLDADITLSDAVTIPAGATIDGNGKQINGTIYAGGDLTIKNHLKVTGFSASYYNRTITIGEDACLEVTGTDRTSIAYGNVFNITGTLTDAKNTDKTTIKPSLIVPKGISITGGNDATLNVTNAYIQIGGTSSKNSSANGTFNLNFTNSIAEFTDYFTLAEPTNGNNPTFNISFKDSVLAVAKKVCIAAPNSTVTFDNTDVTLGTYIRNSGTINLINGSTLTGATIQFGENGGNNGTINVDNSTLTVTASSTGHAFDGKSTGKIVLTNNSVASVTYYKDMTIDCDTTSTFTGTEVN